MFHDLPGVSRFGIAGCFMFVAACVFDQARAEDLLSNPASTPVLNDQLAADYLAYESHKARLTQHEELIRIESNIAKYLGECAKEGVSCLGLNHTASEAIGPTRQFDDSTDTTEDAANERNAKQVLSNQLAAMPPPVVLGVVSNRARITTLGFTGEYTKSEIVRGTAWKITRLLLDSVQFTNQVSGEVQTVRVRWERKPANKPSVAPTTNPGYQIAGPQSVYPTGTQATGAKR